MSRRVYMVICVTEWECQPLWRPSISEEYLRWSWSWSYSLVLYILWSASRRGICRVIRGTQIWYCSPAKTSRLLSSPGRSGRHGTPLLCCWLLKIKNELVHGKRETRGIDTSSWQIEARKASLANSSQMIPSSEKLSSVSQTPFYVQTSSDISCFLQREVSTPTWTLSAKRPSMTGYPPHYVEKQASSWASKLIGCLWKTTENSTSTTVTTYGALPIGPSCPRADILSCVLLRRQWRRIFVNLRRSKGRPFRRWSYRTKK